MRARAFVAVAVAGAVNLLVGCHVLGLNDAPCVSSANCFEGQVCLASLCKDLSELDGGGGGRRPAP
jgi:hypothetical protein